jgi:tRNA threonylcarbamoyladenosine biosynthesis protein TsaE
VIVSHSPQQTRALGQRIGAACRGGEIILLEGTLGAGKTCLSKGIAEALGLEADQVTSPTFTIMQVHHGRLPLYHVDLYRIDNPEEIAHLGLFDEMEGPGVTLIEWPSMGGRHTPTHTLRIRIEACEACEAPETYEADAADAADGTDGERHLHFSLEGDGPAHLLAAVEQG